MDCLGFAKRPWNFREEQMVKELLGKLSNKFDNTLRGILSLWNEELWTTMYGFRLGGLRMANKKDKFIWGKFQGVVNPKDGYAAEDCVDNWNCCLL